MSVAPLPPDFVPVSDVLRIVREDDAHGVPDWSLAEASEAVAGKRPWPRDPCKEARESLRAALAAGALAAHALREDGVMAEVPASVWAGADALEVLRRGTVEWRAAPPPGAAIPPGLDVAALAMVADALTKRWGALIVRRADAQAWLSTRATQPPGARWEAAADIPGWVPLRRLGEAVALVVGEAGAAAVARAIVRAIDAGTVAARWAEHMPAWRGYGEKLGRELQSARDYAAQAGEWLAPPGRPPAPFTFDLAEGVAHAPGDPRGSRPTRQGRWPLGPVEVAWANVEALAAFREALAPAAASAASSPGVLRAATGATEAAERVPGGPPWSKDGPEWEAAQRDLIAWVDGEGWPNPRERGALSRFAKELQQRAHNAGRDMGLTVAKARAKAILWATPEQREAWCRRSLP